MSSINQILESLDKSAQAHVAALVRGGKTADFDDYMQEYDALERQTVWNHFRSKDWSEVAEDRPSPAKPKAAPKGANVAATFASGPSTVFTQAPPSVSTDPTSAPAQREEALAPSVSENEMSAMWKQIDALDVTLISDEVIASFQYQGFNPDAILKSLLSSKKKNGINNKQFLSDVSTLCAITIIKGSITDTNLKKMSEQGRIKYGELETRYGISRGGGRNRPAEVITVARIAATFPGKIIELLQSGKIPGRVFVSDLQTHKLPSALRHQALAACIPQTLKERSKNFLLDLVTAFSVDQTRVISKDKSDIAAQIDRQHQFTLTSHSGPYPSEDVRKKIFTKFNWQSHFDLITPVATHIKTKWPAFNLVNQTEFLQDLGSL
jgi:hypothetical protein